MLCNCGNIKLTPCQCSPPPKPAPPRIQDTYKFDYGMERDLLEHELLYKNRIIYSLPVKVDNWNEDLFLKEEKTKLTNMKRMRCELLVEKTRAMLKNLLRPIFLASDRPFIEYTRVYQIVASAMPSTLTPCGKYGLYLAGLISENDLDHGTHFSHGCGLTASPDSQPSVRNSFIFRGCARERHEDEAVYYGEDVYIQIYESGVCTPLYIRCESSSYDNFGTRLVLRLSQSPDFYCRFKVYPWMPDVRYESEGSAFAPNSEVIIKHTATGRNLAVEYNHWVPTFFGPECVVTCHTYQDSHRMETAENLWKICQFQKTDKTLFVRAAKGEDIPDHLIG
ncbi:cilia- and flagella-associated protein 161-like [Onthophagus taurus]|uniref:cilia- and flagella-associated protein 161-like n=1 Tax=Onthophagus taurus TaxID=166361 RepID=UPI000C2052DA|nr:cilia- and flagella-associated protein 161-like [Onthophagus taurus]XP_022906139.1 cilia- and flagella-associated protein 161-like [Onthophagus taurus]